MENTSDFDSDSDTQEIHNSSLSLPSEPPDIRNWFSSYQYESFVLDTYDDFGGSFLKESEFECRRDGHVGIEEGIKEKEGNFCEARRIGNNSSDDKHGDQSFSTPTDLRNWFPSYESESPVLDTADYFKESVIKERKPEKDGFAIEESDNKREKKAVDLSNCRNNNEIRAGEKLCSKNSFGDVCEDRTLREISDSSQSSLFLSEPPDIRNWFPSYVYESPVLSKDNGFLLGKTECEEDEFANQDSKLKKEMQLWKLRQKTSSDEREHSNGIVKSSSSLGNHIQEKSMNKVSPSQDTRDVEKEALSVLDNLCHEVEHSMEDESFPSHAIIPTKDVEKPSLNFDVPPFKQQQMQHLAQEVGFVSVKSNVKSSNKTPTKLNRKKDFTNLEANAQAEVDLVSSRGNMKFIQGVGASSSCQSTHGRSNNKRNEGKEVQGNDFVTTMKNRMTKRNDENSLDKHRQQHILLECTKSRGITSRGGEKDEKVVTVKRKVLSEVSNFENLDVIEVTGKWKCPQKSKPDRGPPTKQLRLERWVHRL
ncbi:unnamed protein product [Dovyalis caffra]|uniref:Uncharacterized protein n=1 Tax=Dovyalis caffra TaxID=77055 RepID=A0AAV1RHQ9_9ROSI|nr:unnamed protein product [Dovyalis caffra]